jgi:PhnB protein
MSTKTDVQTVQHYLFFDGKCEEALEFYKKAIGAKVEFIMRNSESPEPSTHGTPEKIMHCNFRVGNTQIMASDGYCKGQPKFEGFALSINAEDESECDRIFGALSQGGEVLMPLEKTFYSPRFGMVKDPFGLTWMVIVPQEM